MKTVPFTIEDARGWSAQHPTPFYVYDEEGIRTCVENLKQAFSWNPGFREYFAVKATPTPAILRHLKSMDSGTACASEAEVIMSTRCGIEGKRIMFTSNETSFAEYRTANSAGAIINLDDIQQIDIMEKAIGIPETVCCRYNPGEFAITSDIMGHLFDSKFGMTKAQLFESFRILREKGVQHFGIHAMLSSNSLNEDYYPALARELFGLVLEIKKELGISVEFTDFAGGIGIPYKPEDKAADIFRIGAGVKKAYDELIAANGMSLSIYTELARFVTGPHGYLVTSVIGKKSTYREYIGVDATAACLMRPAIYGAYHHVTVLGKENQGASVKADVVGSLCENNDKFAVERMLPETEIGDILVIHDSGAHGHSMGYNYNGKLRCAEFMMDKNKNLTMIRRAQTVEDLFACLDCDKEF